MSAGGVRVRQERFAIKFVGLVFVFLRVRPPHPIKASFSEGDFDDSLMLVGSGGFVFDVCGLVWSL